jgi:TPR repeat protein
VAVNESEPWFRYGTQQGCPKNASALSYVLSKRCGQDRDKWLVHKHKARSLAEFAANNGVELAYHRLATWYYDGYITHGMWRQIYGSHYVC